jgi:alkylation response protein AidB-like acyl-CoA dehydrogenase
MAHKIAELEVELASLEAAELHMMSELSGGATPGLKASMMKIKGTELSQRLTELAIELAGVYVMPFQAAHLAPGGPIVTVPASNQPLVGEAHAAVSASKYLNDRAGSIYAGSNEIQRNILAKGQLGF